MVKFGDDFLAVASNAMILRSINIWIYSDLFSGSWTKKYIQVEVIAAERKANNDE